MQALMVSGDRSGSGKTSITLAIAALLSRSMTVQTYKVGMDYIDPSYLSGVTGRPCRNLDTFVMNPDEIGQIFAHGARGADLAIVEGVRGLFEGAESLADTGSSASVAKRLGLPVVLVVSARSVTRSAAALVRGFQSFDPGVDIRGVILNNVSGEQHIRKATEAIEHHCRIPVIGAIPRMPEMELTMRHLGLVPFREGRADPQFEIKIAALADMISGYIDLDALLGLATRCEPAETFPSPIFSGTDSPDVRIGIALDEAFNFYYSDLFDILAAFGAEWVPFSPLRDPLPEADGYIIGGGYPELFLQELERNDRMREAVSERSRAGVPFYAECGGLMYLSDRIVLKKGWQGRRDDESFAMCGVFPGETIMPARRVVSYVEGESLGGNPLGAGHFRGHEFHYSDVVLSPETHYSYLLSRGKGISGNRDGAVTGNTLGSYTHLHPVASHGLFAGFVRTCRRSDGEQAAGKIYENGQK
ncbi:MAG: Ni-sirohydrochlorin a,c-diamide synthase [Methanomicrobiales archaeon]|nr:Ni-sirohydrochlorin a,c-diamide synthase [Methanomicrobiales archaeon]